jgi:hypothetical protein
MLQIDYSVPRSGSLAEAEKELTQREMLAEAVEALRAASLLV